MYGYWPVRAFTDAVAAGNALTSFTAVLECLSLTGRVCDQDALAHACIGCAGHVSVLVCVHACVRVCVCVVVCVCVCV